MNNIVIVIPARYDSSRLPGKPLLADTGKPLIQHTYEQAAQSRASRVVVATDDVRIENAVRAFGGEVVLTSKDHATGTDRIVEAVGDIEADVVLNVQGDEPEIEPDNIDRLIDVHLSSNAFASTLACPFSVEARVGHGSPDDASAVKVILGDQDAERPYRWARFFSRFVCAFPRDERGFIVRPQDYFLHLGIYAFSKQSLLAFAAAPPGMIEQTAHLEQLRILEMGERIAVGVIDNATPGVDTAEDYAKFVARFRANDKSVSSG